MHAVEPTIHELANELDSLTISDDLELEALNTLYQLVNKAFALETKSSQLYFPTLFSRMSYALSQGHFSAQIKLALHHFRMRYEHLTIINGVVQNDEDELISIYHIGKWGLSKYLNEQSGTQISNPGDLDISLSSLINQKKKKVRFYRERRVIVTGHGDEPNTMKAIDDLSPMEEIVISFGEVGRNDIFSNDIQQAMLSLNLPFHVSLVDVEVDEDDVYSPRFIVIEPDYLMDVSTVADCVRDFKNPDVLSLLKKYLPIENVVPILMGHVANFFLDQLILNPELTFKEIFPKVFHLNPIAFTRLSDQEIVDFMKKARLHFESLQQVVRNEFAQVGIDRNACMIEPAFYAPAFGLQGRLDLYHPSSTDNLRADIIELKSGKPFRPNSYGLSATHYAQTLLYDLMVKVVNQFERTTTNYILYSSQSDRTLRFAPPVESLQKESIHTRNQLLLLEKRLQKQPNETDLFDSISIKSYPDAKGFLKRDIESFETRYQNLAPTERLYFRSFSGFIAREHALSKVGEQGVDQINGLASMWLDPVADKLQKYNLFLGLSLVDIYEEDEYMIVDLAHPTEFNGLTNFRVGDIAVLYPHEVERNAVLRNQIFKCTIITIEENLVRVRLRSKQINLTMMRSIRLWNVEHDILDSSFVHMYRSLYAFAGAETMQRARFLGMTPPQKPDDQNPRVDGVGMLDHQREVLEKMIRARGTFLLWGPPGTGKTSVMLKETVRYYLNNTDQRLLLLAYTNRAVDEICASIESIGDNIKERYCRIGSSVSAHPQYRDQLLSQRIRTFSRRSEIRGYLEKQRIVVATVSSIIGQKDIHELINFDLVIIDEASQILEPMLAGVLPAIPKHILIGDHKQLPAVVTQKNRDSQVDHDRLLDIDLLDMRDSYFERMYRRCIKRNWYWAFDQLNEQGRMHKAIMAFANEHFYEGKLTTLPESIAIKNHQNEALLPILDDAQLHLPVHFYQQRLAFIPSEIEASDHLTKTSKDEARKIAKLISDLMQIYQQNQIEWNPLTLGVITPFRAQIAQIKDAISVLGIDLSMVTVDTVERYQGSARDIILMSMAVSSISQLGTVVSKNDQGIDRKFNVALTRARKRFYLIGHPPVLNRNEVYADFISRYQV